MTKEKILNDHLNAIGENSSFFNCALEAMQEYSSTQNQELLNGFKKIKQIADSQGWTSIEAAATTQLITDSVLRKFESLNTKP